MSKSPFRPQLVRRARELNMDKSISGEIYFHPTENNIVVKSIDLRLRHPLCEVNNRPRSDSTERWLEAYLIRRAKSNNWILELANKKGFQFLYAQLKFRRIGVKKARPLDLLLYEQEIGHLVVMELKAERVLDKAKDELDDYVVRVDELKREIADVFKLGPISGVRGYIVWPTNEKSDNTKHNFGTHRVIEYTSPHGIIKNGKLVEPWEKFQELGQDLIINFACKE